MGPPQKFRLFRASYGGFNSFMSQSLPLPLMSLKLEVEKKDYKNTLTLAVKGKIQPVSSGSLGENRWKMFR